MSNKNNLPAVVQPNRGVMTPARGGKALAMMPQSLEEAARLAEILSKSEMTPKSYHGKPNDCLSAILMGGELGVSPIQSIQNIAVINNRPSMWGDLVVGLVRASGLCDYIRQEWDPKTETATSRVKRKGQPERVDTFSMAQARRIKTYEGGKMITLAEKNTYRNYPERMCGWRSLTYGLRSEFADILKGLTTREEAEDVPENDAIEASFSVFQTPTTAPQSEPEQPSLPQQPAAPEPAADDAWAKEFADSEGPQPPAEPPAEEAQQEPEQQLFVVKAAKAGSGKTKSGADWNRYVVELSDGRKASTFSDTDFNNALVAQRDRVPVKVTIEPGKTAGSFNLVDIAKA